VSFGNFGLGVMEISNRQGFSPEIPGMLEKAPKNGGEMLFNKSVSPFSHCLAFSADFQKGFRRKL
jgi:hypothetical protein